MTEIDPAVEAAVRARLGPVSGRLVDAAAIVNDAVGATRMDAGSVLLTAVRLIRACRARGGSPSAARAALADCWAITSHADLLDVCAALAACGAVWGSDAQLAEIAEMARDMP